MSEATEKAYVARLGSRALCAGSNDHRACLSIVRTLGKHRNALDLELPTKVAQALERDRAAAQDVERVISVHLQDIADCLRRMADATGDPRGEPLRRNVAWLAAELGLEAAERELLELVAILGQLGSAAALARMLEAESAAKPEAGQPIGFLSPADPSAS